MPTNSNSNSQYTGFNISPESDSILPTPPEYVEDPERAYYDMVNNC